MTVQSQHAGRILITLVAGLCGLLVLVHPDWRSEARAQDYHFEASVVGATYVLIPYQSPEHKFQIIPLDESPPAGFADPGFDDSRFSRGIGAFGSGGDCRLQTTVLTEWPVNSQLLVRRSLSLPSDVQNVRILASVDNDIIGVFFNGTRIAESIAHDECPELDDFFFEVPRSLVESGDNVIAFHVVDRGNESFFDFSVIAELSTFDLSQIPDAPLVPVSEVEVECSSGNQTRIRFLVDATNETGEVKLELRDPQSFTLTSFLEGERMVTTDFRARKSRTLISRLHEQRATGGDLSALALDTIFIQPDVRGPIVNCLSKDLLSGPVDCSACDRGMLRALAACELNNPFGVCVSPPIPDIPELIRESACTTRLLGRADCFSSALVGQQQCLVTCLGSGL